MDFNFFKDLSDDLKRIFLNFSFVLPFWFLYLFLFNPHDISQNLIAHFIFSFCLSVLSIILFFLPTLMIMSSLNVDKSFMICYIIELNSIIVCILVSIFTFFGLHSQNFDALNSLQYIFIYALYYLFFSCAVLITSALIGRK